MSRQHSIINVDPEIMHGTPVFRGTRVPIQNLWDYLEGGDSLEEFLEGFPSVGREQAVGLIRLARKRTARSPFNNAAKIRAFLRFLGAHAQGSGTVYLAGGASAVIMGWRNTAMDVDLKLEPQPPGAFEAIVRAKEELDINVDLAAPDDFIPALPDWRERSLFIARHGSVEFFHYDFYAQALAKIARGHEQDLHDVKAMHRRKLVEPKPLMRLFEAIEPGLLRYPSLSRARFRDRVRWLIAELRRGKGNADERETDTESQRRRNSCQLSGSRPYRDRHRRGRTQGNHNRRATHCRGHNPPAGYRAGHTRSSRCDQGAESRAVCGRLRGGRRAFGLQRPNPTDRKFRERSGSAAAKARLDHPLWYSPAPFPQGACEIPRLRNAGGPEQ